MAPTLMHAKQIKTWIAIGCVLLLADHLKAGLYNTLENRYDATVSFRNFKENILIPLRQLGNPKIGTALNLRCFFIDELLQKQRAQNWSVEDRINFSSYLIRIAHQDKLLDRYTKAEGLLRHVVTFMERDNFLAYANLATASQLKGNLPAAGGYLSIALQLWQPKWSQLPVEKQKWFRKRGWDETTFAWYRRCEEFHQKLVRFRLREPDSKKIRAGELPTTPDNLFGKAGKPIRFVGPNGKFLAGKIAVDQKKRIPSDAIPIVQQLLIWMPLDYRLYWLLGELYNAKGDIRSAKEIFEEVRNKWKAPPATTKGAFQKSRELPTLFVEHSTILQNTLLPKPAEKALNGPRPPFDWTSMAAGLGFGIVIAFFVFWQLKVMKRRNPRNASANPRRANPIKDSSKHVQSIVRKPIE